VTQASSHSTQPPVDRISFELFRVEGLAYHSSGSLTDWTQAGHGA
jgi:hypothetical protein